MRHLKRLLILNILVIIVASGFAFASHGATLPSPTAAFYVNDFANILSSDTEQYIIRAAAALEQKTTAQVVVVTTNDIGDTAIEQYATDLFRKWGIGSKKDDNGLLILIDMQNRQTRVEVGYGLEGALPDGKTALIQTNYMNPFFKENDFDQGIRNGFSAFLQEIYKEYNIDPAEISDIETPVNPEENAIPPIVFLIGAIIIVIIIIVDFRVSGGWFTFFLLRSITRGGRGGGGGRTGGGGGSSGGGGSTTRW